MAKCEKCGTAWTTAGMTLCPICGAGVGDPESEKKTKILEVVGAAPRTNGTTGMKSTRRLESLSPTPPPIPEAQEEEAPKEIPSMHLVDDPPLKVTMFPSDAAKTDADESGDIEMPSMVDASAILSLRPPAESKALPAPARPLNGPLILGALALVTPLMLPLAAMFESSRIMGILGFCMAGFFVPFAPVAWIAGLGAEKRRREQGLAPERQVVIGRQLGQWSTLLLVVEVTVALISVAALRLSGSFPSTFWTQKTF